jgi:hypothetical protein
MTIINKKSSREDVIAAVSVNGLDLRLANKEYQDDEEVVKIAVGQNGYSLRWASDRLKDNKGIVMMAVRQWSGAGGWDGLAIDLKTIKK